MLFTIPRSPRWLVKKGRVAEARAVLQMTGDENYEHDLQEIVASIGIEQSQATEKLFSRKFALPIFLAVSIGMFNQLSGINAILYYLNDIFAHAGFSKVSGNLQAVAIGATNLLFTMIAMSVIDRLGRKTLLLVGSVGTALCLAGVSMIFFTGQHQRPSGLAAGRLHCVFRFLPGGRHLGLPLGSFPQFGARQGPEPGKLLALVHECRHLAHLSADGGFFGRLSLRILFRDDGGAVFRCAIRLSGDQGPVVGRNAEEAGDQLRALLEPPSSMFLCILRDLCGLFRDFAMSKFTAKDAKKSRQGRKANRVTFKSL